MRSTGSPRIAPITSYSHMPFGTGVPPVKPSDGSQPMATAIGIFDEPPCSQAVA
jgi:hypothetical protein